MKNSFSNIVYVLKNIRTWDKKLVYISYIYIISESMIPILDMYILKNILDWVISGVQEKKFIVNLLLFGIIKLMLHIANKTAATKGIAERVYIRLKFIVERMKFHMNMEYEKLDEAKILDLEQKAINATRSEDDGIAGMIFHFLQVACSGILLLITSGILASYNWILIVIIFIGAIKKYHLLIKYNDKIKKEIDDYLSKIQRKDRYFDDIALDQGLAKDVRALDIKDEISKKQNFVQEDIMFYETKRYKQKKAYANYSLANEIIIQLLIYIYLIWGIIKAEISIGTFSLFLSSAVCLSKVMEKFLMSYGRLNQCSNQVSEFRLFLKECRNNLFAKENLSLKNNDIVLKNIYFKYPNTEEYILKNINLTVREGEKIAIVGLNGAGKTTLIKILCGLYSPTKGEVFIGNVNAEFLDKSERYKMFSPVFQETELFATTIEQNITLQKEGISDIKKMEKALYLSGIKEKIDELDKGIKSQVFRFFYDDGIEFSGGEKQKISLARALYKNSKILILDEPTAALDPIRESELYSDFGKIINGRTAFFISHRLSSTKFCDKIILLSNGRIAEIGTHDELMSLNGMYAYLFKIQAEKYVD